MTRRRAFTIAAQGLGGIAGAAIVLPAIGFAVAPIFHRGKERWEAVGPVSDFVEDTYRQVVFTETEGIGDAGKTTAYVRKSSAELEEEPGKYVAVSNRCAHLGCPVRFVEAAGNFICPCHGGVYDFQGKRIGGPPVRPLDQFQTRVRNGQVEVGPRYSVTNQMEPVRARDPGEFTGGDLGIPLPAAALYLPTALMPKLRVPKIPDSVVPAPLRKPAKPGQGGTAKGQAPADLKTSPPERQTHVQKVGAQAKEAPIDTLAWVDQRTGASGFLTGMLYRKVPKGTNWFYTLGSATLFAFIVQATDRRLPGDVLHAVGDPGLRLDLPHQQRRARSASSSAACTSGAPRDGHPDLRAHGSDLLLRRLQVPARAQLGDRRRAADPDDDDGLHRLPAALRPALLLGHDRRHQHQRHRPDRRSLPEPTSCAPAPSSAPPRSRASTRSTCCWCPGRSSP